jgi:hypothetical protein
MTERWRDRKDENTPEGRAGALFRSVQPRAPDAVLEGKVQAVLRGEAAAMLGRPLPVLAAAAIVLMIAGGATAATAIYTRMFEAPPPQPLPSAPVRVPVAVPVPVPVSTPVPVPVPTSTPKPNPSALALESKRIKSAVDALRSGDAAKALTEIEAYESAHPQGLLHREALLAKVTALVKLNREPEALAILDGLTLDSHPRSLELTVLRGEMRARANRCGEAIADFERARSHDALRARAEAGLARCEVP